MRRWKSTEAGSSTAAASSSDPKSTMFDTAESPWDHVFKDVDPNAASLLASSPSTKTKKKQSHRHTMTANELSTFDQMFDMIFTGYMDMQGASTGSYGTTTGIGNSPKLNKLVDRLRQQSKNVKWTSEADQELDRKTEEMDLCDTDQQLLDWAMREVFGESQRYEAAARKVMADPTAAEHPVHLQPLSYPHVIAHIMRTFRDKYGDPHLALSIFDHARHLSIASYVFGCTTPAYNELIETRWRCFRDVRGVCEAMEEMQVNGVEMDTQTRRLAETVRREVGERNLWEEETSLNSGEVWAIIARIEQLIAKQDSSTKPRKSSQDQQDRGRRREKKWTNNSESWKREAMRQSPQDTYEFGKWEATR